jgi:hypothetical protein
LPVAVTLVCVAADTLDGTSIKVAPSRLIAAARRTTEKMARHGSWFLYRWWAG